MSVEPLDLGRYAEVLAILHHYRSEPVSQVLEALAIEEERWNLSDAHWTEELSLCFSRRQESVAFEFSTRYAKMRRRLARQGLDLAGALTKVAQPPAAERRPGAAGSPGARAPARPEGAHPAPELPSYLLEQQAAPKARPRTQPMPAYDHPSLPQPQTSGPGGPAAQSPLPFREGVPALATPAGADKPAGSAGADKPAGPDTGTLPLLDTTTDAMPRFTGLETGAPWEPLAPVPAPANPPMSVEHYAAMVAELNYKSSQEEAILKRYGIASDADRAQLMRTMASYLAANPLQRTRYEALLQRFVAWSK